MYSLAWTRSPYRNGRFWPLRLPAAGAEPYALRQVPQADVRVDQQDVPVLLRCGVRDLQCGGGLAVARPDARDGDRLSPDYGQPVLHRGDDEVKGVVDSRVEPGRVDRLARRHLRGAHGRHFAEQRRLEDPRRFRPPLGTLVASCRPPRPRGRGEHADHPAQRRGQLGLGLRWRGRWLGLLEVLHPGGVHPHLGGDVLLTLLEVGDLGGQLLLTRRQLAVRGLGAGVEVRLGALSKLLETRDRPLPVRGHALLRDLFVGPADRVRQGGRRPLDRPWSRRSRCSPGSRRGARRARP